MTIQQWRYVLAVIDEGGFSKAADACFVSQPTLSAQIAKLESELGMALIDRLSRPVRPLPDALEIIDRARTAVLSLSALPAIASDRAKTAAGSLRIGIIPTLAPYLLPLFLRDFLDRHPGLQVEISESESADILEAVRRFDLDMAILAPPEELSGLVVRSLFYERFVAYMPPGESVPSEIEVDRLDRSELLLLAEGHCLRDQVLDLCGRPSARNASRVVFDTGSLGSLVTLVDQRLGFTLLPELAVPTLTAEQRRRCHSIAPVSPVREIGIVYHPGLVRPSLLDAMATSVVAGLPKKLLRTSRHGLVPWRASRSSESVT